MSRDVMELLAGAGELLDEQGETAVDARLLTGDDGPTLLSRLAPARVQRGPRRELLAAAGVLVLLLAVAGVALLVRQWGQHGVATGSSWVSLVPPPGGLDQARGTNRGAEGPSRPERRDPVVLVAPMEDGNALHRSVKVRVREAEPDEWMEGRIRGFPYPGEGGQDPPRGFTELAFEVADRGGRRLIVTLEGPLDMPFRDLLELGRRIDVDLPLSDQGWGPEWRVVAADGERPARSVEHTWWFDQEGNIRNVWLRHMSGVEEGLVDLFGEPYRAQAVDIAGRTGWGRSWLAGSDGMLATVVWSPEPGTVVVLGGMVQFGDPVDELVAYANRLVPVDRDRWRAFAEELAAAGQLEDDGVLSTWAAGTALMRFDWRSFDHPVDCSDVGSRGALLVLPIVDDDHAVAVVGVTCRAGAGSPPWAVLVYDHPLASGGPRLIQQLVEFEDNWVLPRDGAEVDEHGLLRIDVDGYSSHDVPRCCPDIRTDLTWEWIDGRYQPVGEWPANARLPAP